MKRDIGSYVPFEHDNLEFKRNDAIKITQQEFDSISEGEEFLTDGERYS